MIKYLSFVFKFSQASKVLTRLFKSSYYALLGIRGVCSIDNINGSREDVRPLQSYFQRKSCFIVNFCAIHLILKLSGPEIMKFFEKMLSWKGWKFSSVLE